MIGTIIDYISGDLFLVDVEAEGITMPMNVRARDMSRIEEEER